MSKKIVAAKINDLVVRREAKRKVRPRTVFDLLIPLQPNFPGLERKFLISTELGGSFRTRPHSLTLSPFHTQS